MKKEEEKKNNEDVVAALAEINKGIRSGLNQWADIALEAEAKQWAHCLTYFPRDLMNVTYLFQHVASNIGIKAGHINEDNVEGLGERLRQLIVDMTGYDPHGLLNDLKKGGQDNEKG